MHMMHMTSMNIRPPLRFHDYMTRAVGWTRLSHRPSTTHQFDMPYTVYAFYLTFMPYHLGHLIGYPRLSVHDTLPHSSLAYPVPKRPLVATIIGLIPTPFDAYIITFSFFVASPALFYSSPSLPDTCLVSFSSLFDVDLLLLSFSLGFPLHLSPLDCDSIYIMATRFGSPFRSLITTY